MERATHRYLRSSSVSHKSLLSGHLCHKRGQCWSLVCSDHRLPAWALHDIKQLHFCGAGNPTWITSPRETGCACPPVLISLHQSVVILGNSSCSHSGFIGTALVNLGGFEPTGISLCCSNILDNKRRQMENVHLFQVLSIPFPDLYAERFHIT